MGIIVLLIIVACSPDRACPSLNQLYSFLSEHDLFSSDCTVPVIAASDTSATSLISAYPDYLSHLHEDTLYWHNGFRMLYDDGIARTFDEMLCEADLQDQMSMPYPRGSEDTGAPAVNVDPGRVRCEAFFREMYGNTEEEVQALLAPVLWLPSTAACTLYVTTVNDVNIHLQAVSEELDLLDDSLKAFVTDPGGAFCWRAIAGTDRLSMHSFGIAVDINVSHSDYWLWDESCSDSLIYSNRIPSEIVAIFEEYGFIWGGKWYHYDTMHFEYRPELL